MGYNIKQNPDGSTSLQNERDSVEVLKLDADGNMTVNAGASLGSSAHSKQTLFDDFDGLALDTFKWAVFAGSDTQAVVAVHNAQAGGSSRLVSGDDATTTMAVNGSQINGQLNWFADQDGLVFEARVKINLITSVSMFIGLTDQAAALEAPVTSAASVDTITTNATDAVGFMFDTGQSTDEWFLVGVDTGTDATHEAIGAANDPVADTYQIFKIVLDTVGGAKFYVNGSQVGSAMTNAVAPAVALCPVVCGFSESAASRIIDVDYIFVQQNR